MYIIHYTCTCNLRPSSLQTPVHQSSYLSLCLIHFLIRLFLSLPPLSLFLPSVSLSHPLPSSLSPSLPLSLPSPPSLPLPLPHFSFLYEFFLGYYSFLSLPPSLSPLSLSFSPLCLSPTLSLPLPPSLPPFLPPSLSLPHLSFLYEFFPGYYSFLSHFSVQWLLGLGEILHYLLQKWQIILYL